MKKITFYVFASMFCVAIHAQFPFPTENAVWNVMVTGCSYEQIIYGMKGDTIIAGKLYQKLYMLNDSLLVIDDKDIYYGAIRTEGDRVYFRSKEDQNNPIIDFETLLYDFSKQKGDIIEHGMVEILTPWIEEGNLLPTREEFNKCVSTVKDVYYDQKGRKHLYLVFEKTDTGGWDGWDEWIEGVGSVFGFFWAYIPLALAPCTYDHQLQCLKQNEELKYLVDDSYDKCFCSLEAGAVKIEERKGDNSVYLSILDDNMIVHLPDNVAGVMIKLFDSNGVLKQVNTIEEKAAIIPLEVFNSGVYVYQVFLNTNVIQSGKLIIK